MARPRINPPPENGSKVVIHRSAYPLTPYHGIHPALPRQKDLYALPSNSFGVPFSLGDVFEAAADLPL